MQWIHTDGSPPRLYLLDPIRLLFPVSQQACKCDCLFASVRAAWSGVDGVQGHKDGPAAHLAHVLLEQRVQVLKSHSRVEDSPVAPRARLLFCGRHAG